jgi:hypothetical protein
MLNYGLFQRVRYRQRQGQVIDPATEVSQDPVLVNPFFLRLKRLAILVPTALLELFGDFLPRPSEVNAE